jgi:6-phosphogluconolactonase
MRKEYFVYCGSWGFKSDTRGVSIFRYDAEGRKLVAIGRNGDQLTQSIIAARGGMLFTINERREEGKVTSYRIQPDGSLRLLDCIEPGGASLSYISIDPAGPYLLVSSMGIGAVHVIRYGDDGALTHTGTQLYMGHSISPRQQNSRVHGVFPSPDGSAVIANNFGADEVILHTLDRESGKLRAAQNIAVDWGQGPRHGAWHPSSRFVYVLTEMGSRIYAFAHKNGRLHTVAIYSALSSDMAAEGYAADIIVSGDGRFLYATNRGQQNIGCWAINQNSGTLELIGHYSCGGENPRSICMGFEEEIILVANNAGTVAVLERNPATGAIGSAIQTQPVPNAACVRWIYAERDSL